MQFNIIVSTESGVDERETIQLLAESFFDQGNLAGRLLFLYHGKGSM